MKTLSSRNRNLQGTVRLDGSKSISNRALIALALTSDVPATARLTRLSSSKDTTTLQRLLSEPPADNHYDAGDAGTTFRFLTAFLALQPGIKTLTGSERMKERPVGPLVKALNTLGAQIVCLEKEGFPPLQIGPFSGSGTSEISVQADISSQFISPLLLIAPYLPSGLILKPEGKLVSEPYVEMTLHMMRYFGADAVRTPEAIMIPPGKYQPRALVTEADWSAASYWYAMAVFAENVNLKLEGLFRESWQGDAVLADMMTQFGISTTYEDDGIRLRKNGRPPRPFFEQDFSRCPDLAQTLAVVCAGTGTQGLFSGLETLHIKETDRITALKTELAKVGVSFMKMPARMNKQGITYYMLEGKAHLENKPRFTTYGDHRMAMSFATLAMLAPVEIENPEVVNKSYPGFWEDMEQMGI
ncbi:MAG: 3-phosphoshikimate 1-carboxyvinyltransferase [Saprospiraceae bacterium]|nr:3-phosphoshikimate 1-carboxyvinyltransferase [Saprospiraceae bacterium]